ncbi:transmembrane protein 207 [Pseudophryne corroboree]|uniref:transmembrane protein 207 n=1 Tax=Pseudophryne corroboree TaxID=495146 RepID=UPI00308169B1
MMTWGFEEKAFQLTVQQQPSESRVRPPVTFSPPAVSHSLGWVFLLLLLILILRCGAICCLQCWMKKQARHTTNKTLTVFTLSSLDSLFVTESSRCLHSQTLSPHETSETSVSSIALGELESGAPPSYEELFSTSKV